jgi:hypothetical protein
MAFFPLPKWRQAHGQSHETGGSMTRPWSRPAAAVLCFSLGFAAFNWPALTLLFGVALPAAFSRLVLAWGLLLAALYAVSKTAAPDPGAAGDRPDGPASPGPQDGD